MIKIIILTTLLQFILIVVFLLLGMKVLAAMRLGGASSCLQAVCSETQRELQRSTFGISATALKPAPDATLRHLVHLVSLMDHLFNLIHDQVRLGVHDHMPRIRGFDQPTFR